MLSEFWGDRCRRLLLVQPFCWFRAGVPENLSKFLAIGHDVAECESPGERLLLLMAGSMFESCPQVRRIGFFRNSSQESGAKTSLRLNHSQ